MSVRRNERTGRYESDNPDPMTKAIIEARENTRGMRILRQLIEQENRLREANKRE